MNNTTATLLVCGIFCVYPLICSIVAVTAYKRYIDGGWRAVFFGKVNNDTL